jgi:hypothetical protein
VIELSLAVKVERDLFAAFVRKMKDGETVKVAGVPCQVRTVSRTPDDKGMIHVGLHAKAEADSWDGHLVSTLKAAVGDGRVTTLRADVVLEPVFTPAERA